ncbi:MAG: ATP-binding cassette domain-containing protein [Desulfopila sp.]
MTAQQPLLCQADSDRQPLLRLTGISKHFASVRSLHLVDLDLYPGEILGLVGDNGAGKSTLIHILAGTCKPDSGQLYVRGRQIDFSTYSVQCARLAGIETVFQNGSFGARQPLWRNIFIGRPLTNRLGFIKVQQQREITLNILKSNLGLRRAGLHCDAEARNLSGGERQGLAIGRAMHFNAEIIVLDEPTTALSVNEVAKVLHFVRAIAGSAKGCIFISHNMNHVASLVDRIVVLDKGKRVDAFPTRGFSVADINARVLAGIGKAGDDIA